MSPVALGAFGLVVKATVEPGSERPNNDYFKRLEVNQVAIKKIAHRTVFQDCYHAKQVYREITLLKHLLHDNIIKLVDLFLSPEGDVYIVTEAMDCDLGLMINSKPGTFALQDPHIKWIMYQILRGLRYLHSAGVLHRDLKPQNILVNSQLCIRICDLGLARTNQQHDGLATGYVTTRWYRAPEVMLTWQHYTNALDMWSAGCLFAEMLNRVNKHVTYRDSRGQNYYALFPSDSHDEHLKLILQRVGKPSPEIVSSIGVPAIQLFVQTMVEQVPDGKILPLGQQLGITNPDAVELLVGLLNWDPKNRFTAMDGLGCKYISEMRQYDGQDTRDRINTQFEELDLPVHLWRQIIEKEVQNLIVEGNVRDIPVDALEAVLADSAPDFQPQAQAVQPMAGAAPPPDPLQQLGGADAMAADMDFQISQDQALGYNASQVNMNITNYETEVDQLTKYLADGDMSTYERGLLMSAYGEVDARLNMMRERSREGEGLGNPVFPDGNPVFPDVSMDDVGLID